MNDIIIVLLHIIGLTVLGLSVIWVILGMLYVIYWSAIKISDSWYK